MPEMNMVQAVNSALDVMLGMDEDVLVSERMLVTSEVSFVHQMAFKRSMVRKEYSTPHFQKEGLQP